jgi:hypothetical protein
LNKIRKSSVRDFPTYYVLMCVLIPILNRSNPNETEFCTNW